MIFSVTNIWALKGGQNWRLLRQKSVKNVFILGISPFYLSLFWVKHVGGALSLFVSSPDLKMFLLELWKIRNINWNPLNLDFYSQDQDKKNLEVSSIIWKISAHYFSLSSAFFPIFVVIFSDAANASTSVLFFRFVKYFIMRLHLL